MLPFDKLLTNHNIAKDKITGFEFDMKKWPYVTLIFFVVELRIKVLPVKDDDKLKNKDSKFN